MAEEDRLSPDDPDLVPKLIRKIEEHDRLLKALQRRPQARQGDDPLQWAKRPDVAKRFLEEVGARARMESQGYLGDDGAVPLLLDAKQKLKTWAALLVEMSRWAQDPDHGPPQK